MVKRDDIDEAAIDRPHRDPAPAFVDPQQQRWFGRDGQTVDYLGDIELPVSSCIPADGTGRVPTSPCGAGLHQSTDSMAGGQVMRDIADLHIHSHHSRATSKASNLHGLAAGRRSRGLAWWRPAISPTPAGSPISRSARSRRNPAFSPKAAMPTTCGNRCRLHPVTCCPP